jgi:hypothetical protein
VQAGESGVYILTTLFAAAKIEMRRLPLEKTQSSHAITIPITGIPIIDWCCSLPNLFVAYQCY